MPVAYRTPNAQIEGELWGSVGVEAAEMVGWKPWELVQWLRCLLLVMTNQGVRPETHISQLH